MKVASARLAWLIVGWVLIGLGIIGALLPVMPTTVFLIGAGACFARASPTLEQRLLAHPRYGPSLQAWRSKQAIPRNAKIAALLGMVAGLLVAAAQGMPAWGLGLLAFAEFFLATWMLTRPEP